MAPFLGNPLDDVIDQKELQLKVSKKGFFFKYYDQEYPASAKSYQMIVDKNFDSKWNEKLRNTSGEKENWQELKEFLVREIQKNSEFGNKMNVRLKEINDSEEIMKEILEEQFFLPAHWKETENCINYRRFFTINDLICLRMEDEKVFENYHRFILQLCEENLIQGLRIDHIDGLSDPKAYLQQLRRQLGDDFYIIIEKILEWDEKLPSHWPVQGTSGYGFLATVNQVLTDSKSRTQFEKAYEEINPKESVYNDLIYKQKLFILQERMGGEYANLWNLAVELNLLEEDAGKQKEALGNFLAAFPVYRIYPEEYPLKKRQKKIIDAAFNNAVTHAPNLEDELEKIRKIFLGEAEKEKSNMLNFLQRCQQFTGPLAAKGVEDTSFYIFNEFISHNEVGDSPENFGLSVEGFHQRMQLRLEDFPLSINATATHDTKRGEDARMRINVLSEISEEWFQKAEQWKTLGKDLRKNGTVPDANEEYFIFQMLVGSWPYDQNPDEEFLKRSKAYLQKVLREAKEHSSWAAPNEQYEKEVFSYLKNLTENEDFLKSFNEFHGKLSVYGAVKSLSQALLKVTAPGIPDIYQGTELWDLSYVDPDNRRPVDYNLRKKYLEELEQVTAEALPGLKKEFSNGKIKMFCLHRSLRTRKRFSHVFEEGDYIPLNPLGAHSEDILAFARRTDKETVLVITPLKVTAIFTEEMEVNKTELEGLKLQLPEELRGSYVEEFTQKSYSSEELLLSRLFEDFPVVLLTKSN